MMILVAAAAIAFGAAGGTLDAFTVMLVLWVLVGSLIMTLQPRNAVGWLFGVAGTVWVTGLATAAAVDTLSGRALTVVSWYGEWFWIAGFVLMVASLFLIPNGRSVSPTWRRVLWAFVGVGVAAVALAGLQETVRTSEDAPAVDNPIGITNIDDVSEKFVPILVLFGAIAAIATMVVRYRRGSVDDRDRLKLVVLSTVATVAFAFVAAVFDGGALSSVFWILAFAAIPIGCAIAILRHQLFDVDKVISRTLVYFTLSLVLGAAYTGLVLAGQWVFSSFAGGSDIAIAASTLVVAALFLPVRSHVQRFVDQRFYRRRYDAQWTLDAFGFRLREQIELESLTLELCGVVHETMQPDQVSVWLRTEARG